MERSNNSSDTSWVDFSIGEDVRNARRLEQDRLWSKAIADGRAHLSHREFALQYAPRFKAAMADYELIELLLRGMYCKQSNLFRINEMILSFIVEYAMQGHGVLVDMIVQRYELEKIFASPRFLAYSKAQGHFRVCLRKRPLLDQEVKAGAYDVTRAVSKNLLLLHEGKMARNGRLLTMIHHQYAFDRVFDEHCTNHGVSADIVEPLINRVEDGKNSTLLCFGQTGTGKTYTLYGALEYIAERFVGKSLRLIFYEVHGNKCYDLLQHRQLVYLRFDQEERLHVRGARNVELHHLPSASDLLTVLQDALSLRSSLVTERNPISSRSHAVCSIELLEDSISTGNVAENSVPTKAIGKITLVDLAGSERNYETQQMTAVQHKESADINLALMSLKNCFHAYHDILEHMDQQDNVQDVEQSVEEKVVDKATSVRIPYRDSPLTKVLKDCFTSGKSHHTTIITTISPTPVDLLHSLNSINHVLMMSKELPSFYSQVTVEVPKSSFAALNHIPIHEWTENQVLAWVATVERGRFAHLVFPRGIDGNALLQLTAKNFAAMFEEQERHGRQEQEGPAWVVSADDTRRIRVIGQALYNAVQREDALYHRNRARASTATK